MILAIVFSLNLLSLQVSLKKQATVGRDSIYLSDLLAFESYQRLESQGVKDLRVAQTPKMNRIRVVRRDQVSALIHQARSDINLSWTGVNAISVKRKGQKFSESELEQAVRAWLSEQIPKEGRLYLEKLFIPQLRVLPAGKVAFDIRTRKKQYVGRQSLYIDIKVNGDIFKTLVAQADISLETIVAKVIADLPRGKVITEDFIEWQTERITRLNAPLATFETLRDTRTKTAVREGTILTGRHLEKIPLVERNSVVFLVARSGPLTIRLKAQAMDSGGIGELIRVKNLDSGQILSGRIGGDGTVRFQAMM